MKNAKIRVVEALPASAGDRFPGSRHRAKHDDGLPVELQEAAGTFCACFKLKPQTYRQEIERRVSGFIDHPKLKEFWIKSRIKCIRGLHLRIPGLDKIPRLHKEDVEQPWVNIFFLSLLNQLCFFRELKGENIGVIRARRRSIAKRLRNGIDAIAQDKETISYSAYLITHLNAMITKLETGLPLSESDPLGRREKLPSTGLCNRQRIFLQKSFDDIFKKHCGQGSPALIATLEHVLLGIDRDPDAVKQQLKGRAHRKRG